MTFHFIRPVWLWLLLPAMLYLVWVIYSVRHRNPWKAVCDAHLLSALLLQPARHSKWLLFSVLFLFYVIAIFALSGPAWEKTSLPVYRDVSSMMLVLDLSPNMNDTDLKPDRLTRAKYKIRDLINTGKNTQMGLVAFTEEAFTASPLSQDANTLNALIDELVPEMMPVAGSDSGQGITEGYQLLKQAGAPYGNVLLITASAPTANSWSAASKVAASGGHLNVLAVLADTTANQNLISDLQQLAKTGNGKFNLFSANTSDIQNILSKSDNRQVVSTDKSENANLWRDAGPWFCLLLVPFLLLVIREMQRHENG